MVRNSSWPDGLSDEEAAQRLQSLAIGAADGVKDLPNDKDYRALRRPLLAREDLWDVIPSFIRAQRDLTSLWNHLRSISSDRSERRNHVWAAFVPLFDRVRGVSTAPTSSSRWTGRRSLGEQARVVLSLGPTAFDAVDMLLEEQERPLHNGGPANDERLADIAKLKALHVALAELIELAETGQPFGAELQKLRKMKDRTLQWSTDTFALMLGQSPLIASSAVYGSALWFLINAITKDLGSSATMAGAIVAGTAIRGIKGAE